MLTKLETTQAAFEYFKEHGGLVGQLTDDLTGQVCALGAVVKVCDSFCMFEETSLYLDDIALELYPYESEGKYSPIVNVNDKSGRVAVENCYALAIERLS